jgi:hypothetical protein
LIAIVLDVSRAGARTQDLFFSFIVPLSLLKLVFFVADAPNKKASAFVLCKHCLPYQIFASKAIAYSSGPNLRTSNLKYAGDCGRVVEQMSHLPKVEGSGPGRVGGTRGSVS